VNSEDNVDSEFYSSPETPIELTEIASEDQIKDILLNDEGFASYLSHLDDSLSGSQGFEDGPNQPAVPVLSVPAPEDAAGPRSQTGLS